MIDLSFVSNRRLYDRKFHRGSDPLLKAIGRKGDATTWVVWDLTLGLARDSWQLCQAGYQVVGFEQYQELADRLELAKAEAALQPVPMCDWAFNLTIVKGSCFERAPEWLKNNKRPDVIYLDPMFEEDTVGSALPKKETQWLRSLELAQYPLSDFWQLALHLQPKRVVWKRPLKAPPAVPAPNFQVAGKSVRFDVYTPASR